MICADVNGSVNVFYRNAEGKRGMWPHLIHGFGACASDRISQVGHFAMAVLGVRMLLHPQFVNDGRSCRTKHGSRHHAEEGGRGV